MPVRSSRNLTTSMVGTAAADLDHGSRELYVYCSQLTPFQDGTLEALETTNDINTTDGEHSYQGSLKTTNFIKCFWKGDGNNPYPPAVRKGEQVTIYNIGDTDVWYWTTEGRDEDQRRCDTKRISVSGSRENIKVLTDDNTYFIEIDTLRSKRIRISTSKADGESYRYQFAIDVDNSMVVITDDDDNSISLESKVPRITLRNKKNSVLTLNDESITLACKKDIVIKSEQGNILVQAKGNYGCVADGKITMHSKGNGRYTSESSIYVGAKGGIGFEARGGNTTMSVVHLNITQYNGSSIGDWGDDYV